jgi:hypothetical protein
MMKKPENQITTHLPSADELRGPLSIFADHYYREYMNHTNGGYYYSGALQLYSFLEYGQQEDIGEINVTIAQLYQKIAGKIFAFGQDTFGNQFCFREDGKVVFLNIESGDVEELADSFMSWEDSLEKDFEYLTGVNLRIEFAKANPNVLGVADRLCPKIPFIIGGEFTVNNLYRVSFLECLYINYNIANQIHDLPDGATISLKAVE